MPVEDQVAQIYAATNGYLDRIVVDKVEKFLSELSESLRGNEPELLKKIAGGDWSDETSRRSTRPSSSYAEDFGYDLDEEGHPIEEGDAPSRAAVRGERRGHVWRPGRTRPRSAERSAGPPASTEPMATSQRDVRNRIAAVKNIQKITRAMEMVAAARLRRAEQRIEALRPYADAIRRMTRQAAEAAGDVPRLPILSEHEQVNTVGLLLVAGDRGLAGAFNSNDRARRRRRRARARAARAATSVYYASGRRAGVVADLPWPRGRRELHRLHRPPRLRRRAADRRAN